MLSLFALGVLAFLYGIIVVGTATVVILENRQPAKTIAWVLVIVALPVVGLIAFYFFGQNIRKERFIGRQTFDLLTRSMLTDADYSPATWSLPKYERLIRLNEHRYRAVFTHNNRLQLLHDGYELIAQLLQACSRARHHVHMASYIIEDDALGNLVADTLIDCAKRGVEVRLLYDDVGCWRVKNSFFRRMMAGGVQVEAFMPVRFPSLTHRANYRNHRKLAIVDGHIGFIGGMNIAMRYLSKGVHAWRDLHLRVEGQGAGALQRIFASDWYFVGKELLTDAAYFPREASSKLQTSQGYLQMVSANPVSRYPEIMYGLTWVMHHAERYLYIQTPYFMPTEAVSQALQSAAMSGVDVRLMIPARAESFLLRHSSAGFLSPILKAGVRVYLYAAGFLHAKCAVADDDWCTIGSTNMDFRSFENNFEANAFIYDKQTAEAVRQRFEDDLQHCHEILLHEWEKRPIHRRIVESASRILSPLL